MNSYHSYLLRKSRLGIFYRQKLLFPWLSRKLSSCPALDVGTGLGEFLEFMPPGSKGIDINNENVTFAKSLGRDVQLSCSSFPFSDSSWGQIVCDQVFEHLDDPAPFLSEVRRVLSPGGLFFIGIPCISGYRRDPDHKHFYDLKSLTRILYNNGFVLHSYYYFPLPLSFFGNFVRQQSLYASFILPPA